jgi:hypothetical protein
VPKAISKRPMRTCSSKRCGAGCINIAYSRDRGVRRVPAWRRRSLDFHVTLRHETRHDVCLPRAR